MLPGRMRDMIAFPVTTGAKGMAAIKRVSIYDMDGTIVDSSHRYRTICDENGCHKIDLQYWRANQHRAYDDSFLPLVEQYWQDNKDPNCYTIIATAREMHEPDWRFVTEKLGKPNHLISRPHGSTVKGSVMKINGLKKFFNLSNFKGAEFTFYEDNTDYLKAVCDTFKIRGVYIPSVQGH